MSDVLEIVKQLESHTFELMQRNKQLKIDYFNIQQKLKDEELKNKTLQNTIQKLTVENNSLMTANAVLGSKKYKRETKLKINRLIREIDNCIIKLSE